MLVKRDLVGECPLASVTGVWFLTRMCTHVCLQIICRDKRLIADVALERLNGEVRFPVPTKRILLPERHLAEVARKRLLHAVRLLVIAEPGRPCETGATDWTQVWPFACMQPTVVLQMRRLDEPFVAPVARKRSLTSVMRSGVNRQIVRLSELDSTFGTRVAFFWEVGQDVLLQKQALGKLETANGAHVGCRAQR